MSDLRKHPETARHPAIELIVLLAATGRMTSAETRRQIEGVH